MAGALLGTYLISPRFYLTYVLSSTEREFQVVELITVTEAFLAASMLSCAGWRLWRRPSRDLGSDQGGPRGGQRLQPALLVLGLTAAAAFFFAGEEISWGQTFLGWDTPQTYAAHSGETNLHNTSLPVQSLGSLYLAAVFFGLPLAWRYRDALGLPPGLRSAVPPGPVIFTFAFAFAWKAWKSVYGLIGDKDPQSATTFYLGFLEQINEQKEMLCAHGLLVYGVSCLALVWAPGGNRSGSDPR